MNAAQAAARGAASGSGGGGGRGAPGQFANASREKDIDDSDYEDGDEDEDGVIRAKELDDIGDEDEMAPITLPKDPKVLRMAAERKRERMERRIKLEGASLLAFFLFSSCFVD